jgi:hypothetical protein
MSIRSSIVLLSLALPLAAQTGEASQEGAEALFYKAYFLDNDQSRSAEATKTALGLYAKFLAAAPEHKLAAKAAHRTVVLKYATGDLEGARAFAKKHDALISKAETAAREARGAQARGDEAVTAKLREAMQNARQDGNNAETQRLMEALRRAGGGRAMRGGFGGAGGRAGFGGRRGNRGGGATIPKIAEMKQEDAKKAVATFATGMERMIDVMAQRGQADQADKLEARLDKIQDLVDDGKLAEAQKILDSLQEEMGSMFGRGRRGGGDQGGRRRRGGDAGGAGGAGGERRRRRG